MSTNVKRLSLSEEAISRLIDPRTGLRLRPLGVVGGRAVYPMMGASPDDPSGDDDKEDPDNDDDPEGGSKDPEDGSGSDKGDPQAKITALEEEKQRQYRRRQEAEQRAEAAEAQLREIQDKDKTEEEKQTARLTELETENESLHGLLRESRLENAFLKDNTYTWHNPGRALALADLSDVEIGEDGSVTGLKQALEALAKSDSYLLKTEDKDTTQDEPSTSTPRSKTTKKKSSSKEERDQALIGKYAALRR